MIRLRWLTCPYGEQDKDEEQINHRIPHRFEPITNISPNWCCHCGLVLPLGRKHARKCSECGVTAHTDCIHLVPDFCGMSMEMANKLLSDIKTINSSRRAGATKLATTARPIPSERLQTIPQPPQTPTSAYGPRPPAPAYDSRTQQQLPAEVGRLSLSNDQQQPSPHRIPPPSLDSYPQRQQQPSSGQQQSSIAAPPRHSSASTVSSFGNDARDSIGSLLGGYANDTGRPAQSQQPQQPQPPSFQPYKQQQQPYSAPSPAQPQSYPSAGSAPQKPQASFQPQPQTPQPPQQPQQPYPPRFQQPAPPAGPQPGQLYQQPAAARVPPQAQQQQPAGQTYPQQQTPQQQAQQVVRPPAQQVVAPVAAPPSGQLQQQIAPPQPARQRRIGLEDFNFLAVLGKGNFGKVMLAEEKRTAQLYAIKVLKKEFIIENDEVESYVSELAAPARESHSCVRAHSTKSEKRVFLAAARERHPFLLGLHSCFQTETRIYFVMEYVSGGDLMLHIQREQFTPRRAKFYAAEVLLALEYFHKNGIVYRCVRTSRLCALTIRDLLESPPFSDLKLDNILLTLDGHIKIADYGLCKEDMWFGKTTSTFCGTPEFMAPEIILEQRYGRAVDWWAFGVLIYEMLLGQSPFRGDDEDEIFDAILEDEPLFPIHMPKDSVSILTRVRILSSRVVLRSGLTGPRSCSS